MMMMRVRILGATIRGRRQAAKTGTAEEEEAVSRGCT